MNQKTVLLGVLGVSLLVVAQNLTPLMSVVFLGGRSPSLPLGIWLFIAFTLGLISSRLITLILQGSHSVRDDINDPEPDSTPKDKVSPGKTFFSKSKRPMNSEEREQASKAPAEWQEERPNSVSWGNGEQQNQNIYRSRPQPSERPTEKPKDTVKDTVYDADYRVIIPPYGSPPPSPPPAPQPETTDWDDRSANLSEDEDWV